MDISICSLLQRRFCEIAVAALVICSLGKAAELQYTDGKNSQQVIDLVKCPDGQLLLVDGFLESGTAHVKSFQIAREELNAYHYQRLVDLAKRHGTLDHLPSLDELLKRTAEWAYPNIEEDRATFLSSIRSLYKEDDRLPVFALTYDEANRVCAVLQNAVQGEPDIGSTFLIVGVTLPTDMQWQYACRAAAKPIEARVRMHFPVWPNEGQRQAALASRHHKQLLEDANDLVDRLNTANLEKSRDEIDIDLSTSRELLDGLKKLDQWHLRKDTEATRRGTHSEVLAKAPILYCLLRESLNATVDDSSTNMPLSFGLPSVESVIGGGENVSPDSQLKHIKRVDETAKTLKNSWNLIHMTGNVREWGRREDPSGDMPIVLGAGIFDRPAHWRNALIWNVTDAKRLKDRTATEGHTKFLAGVRIVVSQAVRPDYPVLLAKALRTPADDPIRRRKQIEHLDSALSKLKSAIGPIQYDAEMQPAFQVVRAYLTPGASKTVQRERADAAASFAESRALSQAATNSSIELEEFQAVWRHLAFVEDSLAPQ